MVPTTAAPTTPATARPTRPDPASWRKAIGRRLREAREDAGLRLVDVARAARVSPQYLSEVERGRKEASSEVLQAVTGALGMTLVELAGGVARDLARGTAVPALVPARSGAPTRSAAVLHLSSVIGSGESGRMPGVPATGTVADGVVVVPGGEVLAWPGGAVVGVALLAA